jgi:hypothetical protein
MLLAGIASCCMTASLSAQANAQAGKILGWGIAAMAGRAIGKQLGKGHVPTFDESAAWIREHRSLVDAEMDKELVELRKKLPMPVKTMTVTNIGRDGDWLFYTFVDSRVHPIEDPAETGPMKTFSVNFYCADDEIRLYMAGGYGIVHYHYNPDRKTHSSTIRVSYADCKK